MELSFPLHSAFVALPLEEQAKWQYQALQEELREFEDILAFQNPQSPHLTLQFWPELLEIEYVQILRQLGELAEKTLPFALKIEGVNTFGFRGEDRVLFLSVPFSEELARLKKACPWVSGKPFDPHITLARIRHPQRFHRIKKETLKRLSTPSFHMTVKVLRLYAEINGKKQTPLRDFALQD